jgi:hypothetical protein
VTTHIISKKMSAIVSSVLIPSRLFKQSKFSKKGACTATHGPEKFFSDSFDQNFLKVEKLVFATTTSMLASAHPALAIVDDRLNGDGTGLPLGINDGALGIVLSTVPLLIFALYFTAGKRDGEIIAGGENDDSGLSL